MNAQNMKKTRKKAIEKRRGGVALLEVLIASVVLAIALFSNLSALAYGLSVTAGTRGRMTDYSRYEYMGLLSTMKGSVYTLDDVEWGRENFIAPITIGADNVNAELTKVIYKRAEDTDRKWNPVFVVFMKTPTGS